MIRIQVATQTLRSKPVISSTAAALVVGVACIGFAWTFPKPTDASALTTSEMQSIWGDGCVECAYLGACCIGRQLLVGTCYLCDQESSYVYCCNCCPANVPNPCTDTNCGSNCVGFDQYQHNICGLNLGPCDTCPFEREGNPVGKCLKANYPLADPVSTTCKQ
jgi:hypothetical protein